MTAANYWPPELDAKMVALATDGEGGIKLTQNEIAKRIGRRADVVSRRLHELGVGRVKPRDVVKPLADSAPTSSCKWIEGESKPAVYCGAPTMLGKSWCADHHHRVYVKGSSFHGQTAGRVGL